MVKEIPSVIATDTRSPTLIARNILVVSYGDLESRRDICLLNICHTYFSDFFSKFLSNNHARCHVKYRWRNRVLDHLTLDLTGFSSSLNFLVTSRAGGHEHRRASHDNRASNTFIYSQLYGTFVRC